MSGEQKSTPQSVEEKWQAIEEKLNQFEQNNKIVVKLPNDAEKYLNLSVEDLRGMSSVDLSEGKYILCRFSAYTQKQYNTQLAKMNWADESIKRVICKKVSQYTGVSYDERKQQAILDNEVAMKLEEIRKDAKLKSDRISFLAAKIDGVARSLDDLQRSRRSENE